MNVKLIDTKLMGILNLSSNSFSDGKQIKVDEAVLKYNELLDQGADLIDIGAQSTSYNSIQISPQEEWLILKSVLNKLKNRHLISVDTYNYVTAKQSINLGVKFINDVSGSKDVQMLDLIAANKHVHYISMFSLTIPADKNVRIKTMQEIDDWFLYMIKRLESYKIELDRVILDPGIGFATNPEQSFKVIKNIEQYNKYGIKILIGHSRKSFLEAVTDKKPYERDIETLAASMFMFGKVDYLRVHNIDIHTRSKQVLFNLYN